MVTLKLSEFHYEDSTQFYTDNSGYTWLAEKDGFTVRIGEIWKPTVVKQLNTLDVELCKEFNTSKVDVVYSRYGFRSDCYWTSKRELQLIKDHNSHILKRDKDPVYRQLVSGKEKQVIQRLNQIIKYAVLEGFMPLEIAIPYSESICIFGKEDTVINVV